MTIFSIDQHRPETLKNFLSRAVSPLVQQADVSVQVEFDVDESLQVPAEPGLTELLVQSLVRAAIHEMNGRGELLWTACQTDRGIELELADTGTAVDQRFRWRPLVAAKLGAELRWDDCPQGGAAVTVAFPPTNHAAMRRVA